jgi:hypothetical protein
MYGEDCSLRRRAEKRLGIPNFDLEVKIRSGRRIPKPLYRATEIPNGPRMDFKEPELQNCPQ